MNAPREGHYDFKHAVHLVWHEDDIVHPAMLNPVKDTARARRFAYNLLREWGKARGGTPVDSDMEKWDFGRYTGYAMFFTGKLDSDSRIPKPDEPTRLSGRGVLTNEILRDREERYAIRQSDLDALGRVDEVGIVVSGSDASAYLSIDDLVRLRDMARAAGMVPINLVSGIYLYTKAYVVFSDPTALLDGLEPEETLVCVGLGMNADGLPLYGWTTTLIADL